MKRAAVVFVLALVTAVAASGQDRSVWRTSADIREGSVGSIVGLVAVLSASMLRAGVPWFIVMPLGLFAGGVVGAINGSRLCRRAMNIACAGGTCRSL